MDERRVPVVVGVGQLRGPRPPDLTSAREPIDLLLDAARRAEADSGARLLAHATGVSAVRVASWAYDGLAARVAAAVGATPAHLVDTGLGGHLPGRLLDDAAERVAAGESRVELVVGGEAQATVTACGRAGVDPVAELGWSAEPGGPPDFDPDELGTPRMLATGLFLPTRVYAMYENALRASLGLTPQEGDAWSARVFADLTAVAAQHPAAWSTEVLTPEQVATPGPANRVVCEPYVKALCAMPHVDQAAAVLVTSLAVAREAGVAPERVVHLRHGAGASDPPDVLERPSYDRSPALEHVLDAVGAADAALVDVYSCFPVVPELAGRHLGRPREQVLSVTGGHAAFGGPLNSYGLHAVATVVERLRERGGTGVVHVNGGLLTHQHALVLSTAAGPWTSSGTAQLHEPHPPLADPVPGPLLVETATVEHGRDGTQTAFVIGRQGASRTAVQGDGATLWLAPGQQVGRTVVVGEDLRV